MGLLSKLFGGSATEKRLIVEYTQHLSATLGCSKTEARVQALRLLEDVKADSKSEGTDSLQKKLGDLMLQCEMSDAEYCKKLAVKRREGVTDKDIKSWWNMHDLERRMLVAIDEMFILAMLKHHGEKGASAEQRDVEVRRSLPVYGDPCDTTHVSGDDRPLPYELKDRINRWITKQKSAASAIRGRTPLSTMNATIRAEIKAGRI